MKWGGCMKFFVLLCIFLNVLVTPWGLAGSGSLWEILFAVPLVLLKMFFFIMALVVIESSLSKLRLYRITEFMGAAFVTSLAAVIIQLLEI
jgi:formate hydrogenlyase subunit 4